MKRQLLQSGFSLIEIIVALGLFTVVITVAVGALLAMVGTNQQSQREQSVMTNLSFALDSMTREIRTGSKYYCASVPNLIGTGGDKKIFKDGYDLSYLGSNTNDCENGNDSDKNYHGLTFLEGGQSITNAPDTRIVYFYDKANAQLMRRISGEDAQPITSSSSIKITDAQFFVTGSTALEGSGDTEYDQPAVTIHIKASDPTDPTGKEYEIETTVTQRVLDI